jgi:adenine-specific DNA glycosylase
VKLARVLERVFGPRRLSDIRYDPYLQDLALRIVQHKDPARINWAFLDLAAMICTIPKSKLFSVSTQQSLLLYEHYSRDSRSHLKQSGVAALCEAFCDMPI